MSSQENIDAFTPLVEKDENIFSINSQLHQVREALENYLNPSKYYDTDVELQIPKSVLKDAKGIGILTIYKAGLGIGGQLGYGIIIGKKNNGEWTGPISISMIGAEFGFTAGISKVIHFIIMKDFNALHTFMQNGQLKLGTDANVCIGPYGQDINISMDIAKKSDHPVTIISYSMLSSGLYVGVTLEGVIIRVNQDFVREFYGKSVTLEEVLQGNIKIPKNEEYEKIINLLNCYLKSPKLNSINNVHNTTNNNFEKLEYKDKLLLNEKMEPHNNNNNNNKNNNFKSEILEESLLKSQPESPSTSATTESSKTFGNQIHKILENTNTKLNENIENTKDLIQDKINEIKSNYTNKNENPKESDHIGKYEHYNPKEAASYDLHTVDS